MSVKINCGEAGLCAAVCVQHRPRGRAPGAPGGLLAADESDAFSTALLAETEHSCAFS